VLGQIQPKWANPCEFISKGYLCNSYFMKIIFSDHISENIFYDFFYLNSLRSIPVNFFSHCTIATIVKLKYETVWLCLFLI
jgi:hypothetical protein